MITNSYIFVPVCMYKCLIPCSCLLLLLQTVLLLQTEVTEKIDLEVKMSALTEKHLSMLVQASRGGVGLEARSPGKH